MGKKKQNHADDEGADDALRIAADLGKAADNGDEEAMADLAKKIREEGWVEGY